MGYFGTGLPKIAICSSSSSVGLNPNAHSRQTGAVACSCGFYVNSTEEEALHFAMGGIGDTLCQGR